MSLESAGSDVQQGLKAVLAKFRDLKIAHCRALLTHGMKWCQWFGMAGSQMLAYCKKVSTSPSNAAYT